LIDTVVRLEMLELSPMWDKKPGVAKWWERIKARPQWLPPEEIACYEKIDNTWMNVSKNIIDKSQQAASA
jgi:hypothetical protein